MPKKLTKEQFIETAKLVHGGNYDYSLADYVNVDTKVKIKCKEYGNIFEQTPYTHKKGSGCPKCSAIKRANRKTWKDFLLQKHHDWLKRKYAKDNNINLLVIPY